MWSDMCRQSPGETAYMSAPMSSDMKNHMSVPIVSGTGRLPPGAWSDPSTASRALLWGLSRASSMR
eukprot:608424-Karenia_brevis.AAC.1